ncbi:MAG: FHA domain-containing protein [Bacteroidales bacterium]|nr:FHA domain-containing protein [Bacteroidales bacterium]
MATNLITIGRATDSLICVPDSKEFETVSNNHATLSLVGDKMLYRDHSTNGTIINGQKIHNREVEVHPGDHVILAAVYPLEWNDVRQHFGTMPHRPTVERNIRADVQQGPVVPPVAPNPHIGGRKTENFANRAAMNGPQPQSAANSNTGGSHSRATENFNRMDIQGGGAAAISYPGSNQQAQRPYTPPQNAAGQANQWTQAEIDRKLDGWCWGAFFCNWIWGVCHKVYWPLVLILLSCIPYVGIVAWLVISVMLGLKGNRLAWDASGRSDFDAFVKSQRKWTIAGAIYFVVCIGLMGWSMKIFLDYL